jgi:hypothetical protein
MTTIPPTFFPLHPLSAIVPWHRGELNRVHGHDNESSSGQARPCVALVEGYAASYKG